MPARRSACQSIAAIAMASDDSASAVAGRRRLHANASAVTATVAPARTAARPPSPSCDHVTTVKVTADNASNATAWVTFQG